VSKVNLESYSPYRILWALLNVATENNLPVVFYRNPNEENVTAFIGNECIHDYSIQCENKEKGFAFSPFQNFNNTKSIFIKSAIRIRNKELIIDNANEERTNTWLQAFINYLETHNTANPYYHAVKSIKTSERANEDYISLVNRAVKLIQNGKLDKVVLASRKEHQLPVNFNVIEMFTRLVEKYKRAFASFVSIPEEGTWIGATPEQLMRVADFKIESLSLAGTKKHYGTQKDEWRTKEYIEQEMVTHYIASCFKESGFQNVKTKGPETAIAGNVMHLKTSFSAKLKQSELKKCTTLLNKLHPTPAVCGLPKLPSYEFIKSNERFSRDYYAGYLGPVWLEDALDLYVNLRCMQVLNDSVYLYSGAGITSDSNPEKEKAEIDMKFNTLLTVIQELQEDKDQSDARYTG
jgi:isochorismate synthase